MLLGQMAFTPNRRQGRKLTAVFSGFNRNPATSVLLSAAWRGWAVCSPREGPYCAVCSLEGASIDALCVPLDWGQSICQGLALIAVVPQWTVPIDLFCEGWH
jgi:hypothetical protein